MPNTFEFDITVPKFTVYEDNQPAAGTYNINVVATTPDSYTETLQVIFLISASCSDSVLSVGSHLEEATYYIGHASETYRVPEIINSELGCPV